MSQSWAHPERPRGMWGRPISELPFPETCWKEKMVAKSSQQVWGKALEVDGDGVGEATVDNLQGFSNLSL